MTLPLNALEAAIVGALRGRAALVAYLASATAIYNPNAPDSAALDYVTVSYQSGGDQNDNPHRSLAPLYLVKGVSGVSLERAGLIDAEADAVLHGGAIAVAGWSVYWLRREGIVRYSEALPGGGRAYHSGGLYRVRLAV